MWFLIIFFIIVIILFMKSIDNIVLENRKEKKEKEDIIQKGISKYDAIFSTKINHISGLSLAENSECIIYLCKDLIVVESAGNVFKLQINRILDMNIKTSKEIQNSISGAISGYMILGAVGAILNSTITDIHKFFLIIYKNKENEKQCISFDMKNNVEIFKNISNYIEAYKIGITNKKEIEL